MGALDNQVVIVTGGGTGIGAATALAMAAHGARTVVVAGRRMEPLERTVAAVNAAGGHAVARSVDLEDGDAAAALGHGVLAEFGQVDVLVNNAGHSTRVRTLSHVSQDEFESVFKVNVHGVYRLTQSLLESMVKREQGTVITVASMAGLSANLLGGVPYGAAKAAVINMMTGLNAEVRNRGVRGCTIIPGEVNTPILDNRPMPPGDDAREQMMQPEDLAAAILLCATMPGRTIVEQIHMRPTRQRDLSRDLAEAAAKTSAE
jgi:NADP-dependent 3-hydroxy acid dehydrogenase YdfG